MDEFLDTARIAADRPQLYCDSTFMKLQNAQSPARDSQGNIKQKGPRTVTLEEDEGGRAEFGMYARASIDSTMANLNRQRRHVSPPGSCLTGCDVPMFKLT